MLPSPAVPPLVPAPSRAVQFVVELVGPRSIPATQAAGLMRADWQAALGSPELWAMAPSDTAWHAMDAAAGGSYDSVALAWDLVTPTGTMSSASATHLVGVAERFANAVGRRAIPLTAPGDVPKAVRSLQSAQEALDAGVGLLLVASRPVSVVSLAQTLEGLGLRPFEGEWGWFGAGHPEPLFSATPFEVPQTDGLTLGFRLARCPDPNVALEGLFWVLDAMTRSGFAAFDEDRQPLRPETRESLRQGARAATSALDSVGLRPGSWAALKAFP